MGEIVKEMECLISAVNGSSCEIAGRLPLKANPDNIADMLPETDDYECKVVLNIDDEKTLKKLTANMVNKKWEMVKLCLNVIDDQEESVKRMTEKEKKKENVSWNEDEMKNVNKLRVNNVRFLNLKNGTKNVSKKMNVLEEFCIKKGVTEKKECWRRQIEEEIEKKESEVEEMKKKKMQARSKKRKLELFKECQTRLGMMIVDWKETPKKDEESKFVEWKEKVLQIKMKNIKKKNSKEVAEDEDDEEKTTAHLGMGSDQAEHEFKTTTTKREPTRNISSFSNFSNLQLDTEAAKVSGHEKKQKIFTKPRHDYRSIESLDRVESDCTSGVTNGRGVWDRTGPPGQ